MYIFYTRKINLKPHFLYIQQEHIKSNLLPQATKFWDKQTKFTIMRFFISINPFYYGVQALLRFPLRPLYLQN